jgi:hypothetical protein
MREGRLEKPDSPQRVEDDTAERGVGDLEPLVAPSVLSNAHVVF